MTQVKNFETAFSLVPLEDLLESYIGGDWGIAPDSDDPEYVDVKCIRATELKNWTNEKAQTAAPRKIKKSSLVKRNLLEGDIILEISGGGPEQPVGRVEIITKEVISSNHAENLVCTNFFRMLRPNSQVIPKFLKLYLDFFYLCGPIQELQSGSNNLRNLRFNDYLKIQVPLPDIEQQDSIIQDIEIANSQIDSGVAALCDAEQMLELYRQSVLKDAFEGKLTADWRASNPDLVEPADKLLARIEAERKADHQVALDDWKNAVNQWETNGKNGKKPTKPKLVKSYQDSDIKCNSQSQLPPSWTTCLLGSLMIKPSKNGVYKPQSEYKDDGIPIVRIENLKPSKISSLDKLKKVELDSNELLQYKLTNGDLVLNRVNSIEHIGKSAFINQLHSDLVFESNLMKFHPSENFISRKYLSTYLNSPAGLKELRKNAKHAVNQASINQDDVANAIVILPGYAEQIEIGRIFERLELLNAHLSEQIKENIYRAKTLKQSILKQAFSGYELL